MHTDTVFGQTVIGILDTVLLVGGSAVLAVIILMYLAQKNSAVGSVLLLKIPYLLIVTFLWGMIGYFLDYLIGDFSPFEFLFSLIPSGKTFK